MYKMGMVLATLVALLGATAGWAQESEDSESAAPVATAEPAKEAVPAAMAEPAKPAATAACDSGCCEDRRSCGCRGPLGRLFDRRNSHGVCDSGCEGDCNSGKQRCNNCGQKCSLSAICDWLCFRRETVHCPKGPARRVPPLYTFFPCNDCGDGCGGACANAHGTGCNNCDCGSK